MDEEAEWTWGYGYLRSNKRGRRSEGVKEWRTGAKWNKIGRRCGVKDGEIAVQSGRRGTQIGCGGD